MNKEDIRDLLKICGTVSLFGISISILVFFLSMFIYSLNIPKEGEKIGYIVKIERMGTFRKTWEACLIRGGLTDGSGVIGEPFNFTIEDESIIEKALDVMKQKKEVILFYKSDLFTNPLRFQGSAATFCYKIEESTNNLSAPAV